MSYKHPVMLLLLAAAACGGPSIDDPSQVVIDQTAPSETTGVVTGLVRDAKLAILPNATVDIVAADYTSSAVSDSKGQFRFTNVPAGADVVVTVSMAGYNTVTLKGTIPDAIGATDSTTRISKGAAATAAEAAVTADATPKNNGSIHFNPILFELQSTLTIYVFAYGGSAPYPPLGSVESLGTFLLPCSLDTVGTETSDMLCGAVVRSGTLTSDSDADDTLLGTLTFTNVPSMLDLMNWFGQEESYSNYTTAFRLTLSETGDTPAYYPSSLSYVVLYDPYLYAYSSGYGQLVPEWSDTPCITMNELGSSVQSNFCYVSHFP